MNQTHIIPIPGFSEPVSCFSHLLASFCFLCFTILLIYRGRGNGLRVTSLFLYGVCALYLFSMSGVYHLLEPGGMAREVFQRLDHSGIWAMIAGTFTPIHMILFRGVWRWGVLVLVWSIAITGLTLEVIYFTKFPEWLSLLLYLSLGWLGLLTYILYIKTHNEAIIRNLVFGGIAYSLGGVFEFLRWPTIVPGIIGPHEIFHFFVILGAFFHGKFIYLISDISIRKKLTFLIKDRGNNEYYVVAKGENIRFKVSGMENLHGAIEEQISRKYSQVHKPPVIRLQYLKENFMVPGIDAGSVCGDSFHSIK
ncbi:MAG: hemolysin III family protein [Oligoflexales bacterium]